MTRTHSSTRRRLLAIAGSSAVAGLAGCLGSDGTDGETTEESMDDDSMEGETDTAMDDDSMGTETDSMDDDSMEGETDTAMGDDVGMEPTDPAEAPRATVDRFSEAAGTLHVRASNADLPGADEPIDFDDQFLTTGFGPDGEVVRYYDFDVQPTAPAPIFAFVRENGDPVEGQLNVVGVVPGDEGYNDFWQVNKVTVPDEYEANAVTDVGTLMETDYDIEATSVVKNCPVVPEGSTASMRHADDGSPTGLVEGWYGGEVVSYFLFGEAPLAAQGGSVPLSPIYVSFNTNPGQDGGGPPSGFMTEDGSDQTHNVVATLPGDAGYSPLWDVNVYDNADFDAVSDLDSALDAEVLAAGAAHVNCPVVSVN